jgi:hypothetical protein
MTKKILLAFIAVLAVFGLASCETEPTLTEIVVSGIEDISVDNGATFNVLDGVTALGNDDVDYTDQITLVTTSSAVNTETGALDTLQAGVHFVRYEVRVGDIVAQYSRNITVKAPVAVEGELVVNGDMASGIGGWNDPTVVYVADGAAMTQSSEDGAMKVEVTAGAFAYTPRFGQMNIPFENGKTYEITFEAKSSVEKEIALQVGELLPAAPWFNDFLPSVEPIIYRTITTEWATYSYKFTMTQDNDKGGILFGLGTVKGNAVNATMHFDNIMIEESQLDPDISAPIFQGIVNEVTLKTGDTFDPLAGVTAIDARDGDLTSEIEVKIYNSLNELVSEVDTSIEANYRIVYIVSDSSGNFRTQEVLLAILGLTTTDTGKILNGDFAGADLTPWTSWGQTWGTPADFVTALTNETATIDITNPGGDGFNWTIQFIQADVLLEQGDTYVLSFDAKASVERDIGVVFYNADTQINYLNVPSVALTTEMASFEFMFTMTNADILTQLQFLMGTTTNYAAGMVTLDNVMLSTVDQEALLKNSDFTDIGFYTWGQDWGAPAEYTFAIENEMFVFDVTNPGSEGQPWTIQFNQSLGSKLEAETTYVLTFDAYADVARDINALVLHPTTYARHGELLGQMLTTSAQTYTLEFTTLADNLDTVNLSFELGTTAAYAAGKVYFDNISLVVKDETTELINNGAANPAYGWTFYNEGAGQGTMDVNNGTLEINVSICIRTDSN